MEWLDPNSAAGHYKAGAERYVREQGKGKIVEGPYSFFVEATGEGVRFEEALGGFKNCVFTEVGIGFPGTPILMRKDNEIESAGDKYAVTMRLVTDSISNLKKHIENETGLSVGHRLVYGSRYPMQEKYPDGSYVVTFALKSRGLVRLGKIIGEVHVEIYPKSLFKRYVAERGVDRGVKVDVRD